MISSKNIFYHELIGLELKVVDSSNPSLIGLRGTVVDETKKTLLIELPKVNSKSEVPKASSKSEVPKASSKSEVPKASSKSEVPKVNSKSEVPKASSKSEVPKANPDFDLSSKDALDMGVSSNESFDMKEKDFSSNQQNHINLFSEKLIQKDVSIFQFKVPDGTIVEIDGKLLLNRPEDRIKKRYKKI